MEYAHILEGTEPHSLRGVEKASGTLPGRRATTVFAEKLANYDVSKGTIRLPYTQPLPKDLIAEIATWCYGQYAK